MGVRCSTPTPQHAIIPSDLETGDIILFHTKSSAGSVTRCCTRGEWDHVAIVLRTQEGYRTVECTGQGIGCWVLQERLDDHIVKAAAVRRLKTELTNDMINGLNAFLQSVKDKPYRTQTCLWLRLLYCSDTKAAQYDDEGDQGPILASSPRRPKSSKSQKYAVDLHSLSTSPQQKPAFQDCQDVQQKKNFFCSSFVAACFMKMGLLPMSPLVDHYLPGHFSSSHTLPWLNHAYLDDEIPIVKVPRDEWNKSHPTITPPPDIPNSTAPCTSSPSSHIDPRQNAKYLHRTFSSDDNKQRPPPLTSLTSISKSKSASSPGSPTSPHSLIHWSHAQKQLFIEQIQEQINIAMTWKQIGNDAYIHKDYHKAAASYVKILGYVSGLHPLNLTNRLLSFLPPCDHHSSLFTSLFTLQSRSTSSCTAAQLTQIHHLIISVHLNMSACLMKLHDAKGAWQQAHTVISNHDARNGKAWQRRGDAYLMMGPEYASLAERDLSEAAALLPTDKAVATSLQEARRVLLARDPNLALERLLLVRQTSSTNTNPSPSAPPPLLSIPSSSTNTNPSPFSPPPLLSIPSSTPSLVE